MTTPADSSTPTQAAATPEGATNTVSAATSATAPAPQDSYVKLAMRNMVSKGGKSLFHFGLTLVGLLGILVGLAYLTR